MMEKHIYMDYSMVFLQKKIGTQEAQPLFGHKVLMLFAGLSIK